MMSLTHILDDPAKRDRLRMVEIADARARLLDRHVARRLRQIREERELTTFEVAKRVGLPEATVIKYENGESRVSAGRLLLFAEALCCPPETFFEGFDAAEGQPER